VTRNRGHHALTRDWPSRSLRCSVCLDPTTVLFRAPSLRSGDTRSVGSDLPEYACGREYRYPGLVFLKRHNGRIWRVQCVETSDGVRVLQLGHKRASAFIFIREADHTS